MSGGADEENTFKKSWSGFDFCRLSGVVILTFIFVIVALILDDLGFASKENKECVEGVANCAQEHSCTVRGLCGFSSGTYKYTKKLSADYSGNPTADPFTFCGLNNGVDNPADHTTNTIITEYKSFYNKNCLNKEQSLMNIIKIQQIKDDSCIAVHAGNIWLIGCIISLISNLFIILLLTPLYCCHNSIFCCDICNKYTYIILGILFTITWISQLIACGYWLIIQPCDRGDIYFRYNFSKRITNILSYSIGLVLISMIANCVACATVCFCWGDNRVYGENPDETDKEYAIKPSTHKDPFAEVESQEQQQY